MPADVVRRVFAGIRAAAAMGDPVGAVGLSPREREILVSFARGMSYREIAEAREIKAVTVPNSIYGIRQKLRVGSMQGTGALGRAERTPGRLCSGRLAVCVLYSLAGWGRSDQSRPASLPGQMSAIGWSGGAVSRGRGVVLIKQTIVRDAMIHWGRE